MPDYRDQFGSLYQRGLGPPPQHAGGLLSPSGSVAPPPGALVPPTPSDNAYAPAGLRRMGPDVARVVSAGGALTDLLMHPSFLAFENLFRKLAETAMFTATPQRPFKFELGAFEVPKNQALLISDYRFRLHRLSGAVAGDTIPLENERLTDLMVFDFTISGNRKQQLRMEIDPVPIQSSKEAFERQTSAGTIFPDSRPTATALPPASAVQYNFARFAQSVIPAGAGLAALPLRDKQFLGEQMRTQIAYENQRVQGSCTIFRAIPIPIAFFELDMAGVLINMNTMRTMLDGVKPQTEQGQGAR